MALWALFKLPWAKYPPCAVKCLNEKIDLVFTNPGCVRGCPKILSPVCGSNGKTYVNKCSFEIAACLAKKKGLLLTSVKGPCKGRVLFYKKKNKAHKANDASS